MKIAYIIYPEVIVSNKSNGVRAQAMVWGDALKDLGHDVTYIDNWGNYDWREYDVLHFFGSGLWTISLAKRLSNLNKNIVLSPIIDPIPKPQYIKYKLKYYLSSLTQNKINFNDNIYEDSLSYALFKKILVRSSFEKEYINRVYHVANSQIRVVQLAFDKKLEAVSFDIDSKQEVCLHISSIYQPRKNVIRLVDAAKKYGFNLILAGNTGSDEQFRPIKDAIGNASNIEVLGFVSEKEKLELYRKAKVFALPSIQEGVGIVALDAAVLGCEIAITDIGGPKEYYYGKCAEVAPYDVDSIGQGITSLLNGEKQYQPSLSKDLIAKYSPGAMANKLVNVYKEL